MSFNRLRYDKCAYKQNLEESMAPGCYQFYAGKYDNANQCRVNFGIVGGNDVSLYKGNIVDLESDLRGQTRAGSLCPSKKFMPRCKQPLNEGLPSGPIDCRSELANLPSCDMFCYQPVTYAPSSTASVCPGLYETKSRAALSRPMIENFSGDVPEDFSLGYTTGNYDSYPK